MSSGVLENCNKHSSNDNTAATKIKQQAYVENNVSQQLTPLPLNYPTHSQDMHPRPYNLYIHKAASHIFTVFKALVIVVQSKKN